MFNLFRNMTSTFDVAFSIETTNMESTKYFEIKSDIINLIAEKYQRNEVSLQEDVKTLKNWMKTQLHLPEILDDKSLENFLILNKFSIERAKQRIDNYYTLRSQIPDMFGTMSLRSTNIKEMMKIVTCVPLPKMTKDMYRVWIFKIFNQDLIDKIDIHDMMIVGMSCQEIRLKEDVMFGDVMICDMEGFSFGFLKKITPGFLTKMITFNEKVYSFPLKGIFVVNSPSVVNTCVATIKSLLKTKVFDKIVMCPDTSILSKSFPKDLLPKDYGGEGPSVEELHERLKVKLNQYQSRFDLLDKLRVDESLRPEELKNDENLGFHGNFRKLNID